MSLFVVFPYYVQPPCISAHDNPFGFYIQKPVYISRMIICICNKQTFFPLLSNLDLLFLPSCMATTAISPKDLRCFMYFASLLLNNVYGGFVLFGLTIILSKYVAVEMTSHQNSPFSLELMPTCFNIGLALPTGVGIFNSRTEFCWGVPGAVNSKITPRFCLSHSFWRLLFSPLLSSLIPFISVPYFLDNPLHAHWYHFDLVTFLTHKDAVTAIT